MDPDLVLFSVRSIYDEWTAERRFYGDNIEIIFGE